MKRPAVFFDRDNTLIVGNDYLGDPAGVQLVAGAAQAIARARRLGYATIVVSNQSGVARGLFDESAVLAVNQRLDQLLLADDPAAVIDRHEFCPFHPEATVTEYRRESDLRKPRPGMILQAAEKLALDLRRSWLIGDAPRDVAAGHAAGCRTILFTAPELPASPAAQEDGDVKADFSAASLLAAIDVIESNPEPPMRIAAESSSPPALAGVHPGGNGSIANVPAPLRSPINPGRAAPTGPPPTRQPGDAIRPPPSSPTARMEALLDQILTELRRRHVDDIEFSVSKLLAGIVQILSIGVVFLAYLNRNEEAPTFIGILLLALFLQTMTISLLIMGRQR